MATLRVKPARSSGWAVVVSGRRVDTKPTKKAAVSDAKRRGKSGDTLHVHRSDGTFQRSQRLRR